MTAEVPPPQPPPKFRIVTDADIRAAMGEPTIGEWLIGLVVVLALIGLGFWIGRKSVKGAGAAAAAPKV